MAFASFCQTGNSEIHLRKRLMTSSCDITRVLRDVDQESVDWARNWTRAVALTARGSGEEHRERRRRTKWSPAARRRPWRRRSVSVGHNGDEPERGGGGIRAEEERGLTLERLPLTEEVGEDGRRRIGAWRPAGGGEGTARRRRMRLPHVDSIGA